MNNIRQLFHISLISFFLIGCTPGDQNAVTQPSNGVEYPDEEITTLPDVGITTDDILENPDLYQGQMVQVRAEVEEWLNPRAIVLDAPGIVADNLLVITEDVTTAFEDPEVFGDAIWEVNGTVQRFEYTAAIDTLDLDLKPDLLTTYEGAPYIVADSVTLFED